MKNLIIICALVISFTSCKQTKQSEDGVYGSPFEVTETISVEELMSKLDESQPQENLVVSGTIADVCQVKGCWLTLKTGNDQDIRVSFKDYGFFVPKDVSGKSVVLKGVGKIETTSVEDLQHYAQDEGQSEEEIAAITEPLEEYVFVAEGVKIK